MDSRRLTTKLRHVGRPNQLGENFRRYSIGFTEAVVEQLWAEAARRKESISEVVRVLVAERLDELDIERADGAT